MGKVQGLRSLFFNDEELNLDPQLSYKSQRQWCTKVILGLREARMVLRNIKTPVALVLVCLAKPWGSALERVIKSQNKAAEE